MAINSSGWRRAKYKKMLVDWAIGFGLIILFHFVIIAVLHVNTALVDALNPRTERGAITDRMLEIAFSIGLVKSFGAAIIYSILSVMSLLFLIIYIKRMLMTCFLIMIAPIVPLSYCVGGNRAGIFNQWLKEFCYNVLIQPFHCIVYIAFAGTSLNLLYASNEISGTAILNLIYAVASVCFIFMAEKVIRTVFGFTKSKSVASKMFSASMATSAINSFNQMRNARNSDDDDDDGEEEMPSVMPDNTTSNEAMANFSNRVQLQDTDYGAEGAGIGWGDAGESALPGNIGQPAEEEEYPPAGSQTEEYPPAGGRRQTEQGRRKKAREQANRGEATGGHANTQQKNSERPWRTKQEQMPEQETSPKEAKKAAKRAKKKIEPQAREFSMEEQFMMAAMTYRDSTDPNMTQQQLIQKIDMLRRTPMKELEKRRVFSDIVFKTWIDKVGRNLEKRGVENPQAEVQNIIMHMKM